MRVSDNALYERYATALNLNREAIRRALEQLADGKRVRVPSDDPSAARASLNLRGRLVRVTGYLRSVESSRLELDTVDSTLTSMFELLSRAREKAVAGGSVTADGALAVEVEGLRADLLRLANTHRTGRYLFGGTETQTEPFGADGSYAGDAAEVLAPIDDTDAVGVTLSGAAVLHGAGNAFQTLDDLADALRAEDYPAIQAAIAELDAQMQRLNEVRADVGYRLQRLDAARDRLGDEDLRILTRLEELEGADLARVASDLVQAETAGEALSSAAARVLGRSLFDFLG